MGFDCIFFFFLKHRLIHLHTIINRRRLSDCEASKSEEEEEKEKEERDKKKMARGLRKEQTLTTIQMYNSVRPKNYEDKMNKISINTKIRSAFRLRNVLLNLYASFLSSPVLKTSYQMIHQLIFVFCVRETEQKCIDFYSFIGQSFE